MVEQRLGTECISVPESNRILGNPTESASKLRFERAEQNRAMPPIPPLSRRSAQPLAMQKVEGSNPFSRFPGNPAPAGFSASGAEQAESPRTRSGGSVPDCAR
jgi:hypothetical protein